MPSADPVISVLLPVYNAERYVATAIRSILRQTYGDFELIIINDASTDGSEAEILKIDDPRVRYHRNSSNLNIVETLNLGLDLCRGQYIARMDADDIALPRRFADQVARFEQDPSLCLCGGWVEIFGARYSSLWWTHPSHARCDAQQLHGPAFCHPLVMMRHATLERHHLRYRAEHQYAEDYALWCELLRRGRGTNIQRPLLRYRVHPHSISRSKRQTQLARARAIQRSQLEPLLQRTVDDQELAVLSADRPVDDALLEQLADLSQEILTANARHRRYSPGALSDFLYERNLVAMNRLGRTATRIHNLVRCLGPTKAAHYGFGRLRFRLHNLAQRAHL